MSEFLKDASLEKQQYAIVGYPIEKTLSDFGTVSRAVLEINGQNDLSRVVERTKIRETDGVIKYYEEPQEVVIPAGSLVSTNFWGFTPAIFEALQTQFTSFVAKNGENIRSEFYIPYAVNDLLESDSASVDVLTCRDSWMGVTYREDKPGVMEQINSYVRQGTYPESLWN
jgi:hypothetical protein